MTDTTDSAAEIAALISWEAGIVVGSAHSLRESAHDGSLTAEDHNIGQIIAYARYLITDA